MRVLRSFRDNGRTRINLVVGQDVFPQKVGDFVLLYILQSTPERRSALLLDEGLQPVAFTLWQEVCAYSSRSNVSFIKLCARIIAELEKLSNFT